MVLYKPNDWLLYNREALLTETSTMWEDLVFLKLQDVAVFCLVLWEGSLEVCGWIEGVFFFVKGLVEEYLLS